MTPLRAAVYAGVSSIIFGCMFLPSVELPRWLPLLIPLAAVPLLSIVRRTPSSTSPRAEFPLRIALAVAGVLLVKWFVLHFWLLQVTVAGTPGLAAFCTGHELFAMLLLVWCARALSVRTPWAVLLPLAFGAEEAFRALVFFDGYPWFRWGHPLIEFPMIAQGADLIGEIFCSLLVLSCAGAMIDARERAQQRAVDRSQHAGESRLELIRRAGVLSIAPGALVFLLFLAFAMSYGAWRLGQTPAGQGPGVLLIQTNLPTSNKVGWAARDQVRDIPAFAELTMRGALDCRVNAHPISLVVWPETMLAGYGLEPETIAMQEANGWFPGDRFQKIVSGLSARIGAPMLVGSPVFIGLRADGERFAWDKQFNSAYLVNQNPPPYPRYDKIFLAPFGETMPYISNWDWLERTLLAIGAAGMTFDLDRGGEPVRFEIPWNGRVVRVAPAICFEDAMSWVTRDLVYPAAGGRVRGADLLVNISNDGWFGWFDIGRAQHLQLARFRCIETRTPMVRSANTGLCAAIDSSGRIVAAPPPPRTSTWLYAAPPLDDRAAPFAAFGEVASTTLMLTCSVIVVRRFVRTRLTRSTAVASAATVMPMLAITLPVTLTMIMMSGCDSTAPTTADQPWSSRSQSIEQTGTAKLSDQGRAAEQALPVESSGNARTAAVTLLKQATTSQVPIYRANGCEALTSSPEDLRAVVVPLLSDPNRGVRFVAAMGVGRARLTDLADHVQPLLVDESPSVRAAAIYALTKLGRPVDPSPLGAMVISDDPEIRSNAYLVLGELHNHSAVPMIRASLGKGMQQVNPARIRIVELQAAEALVRLGEVDGIEPIRAALYAPSEQAEFTALAAQQVARLKDEGSRPILMRLIDGTGISARPTEIRIVCASALAQISVQDANAVTRFARTLVKDREASVRAEAALALGYSSRAMAVPELEPMLFDPSPSVQLAAALAIVVATAPH
ncbi:MAG: apolipoprotein N-acyltransferase [Planctomycetota bacterium]|nr:MAG: apolipoprotein N-acyltransferase [Planctomycetota bacterium]